ncbi:MAG: nucleotidyltransferase domain-containing protein [Candidatus Diapherotrites archaeon]|nr:nucleotidyltransferase domain-containing protein [Candidatus Diapherotrites archaeon]
MDILFRLIDSKSKSRLLSKFLERPGASFSVSDLGRLADLPKASVSVIIRQWEEEVLVQCRQQGRNKLVSINSNYYLLPELKKISEKTRNFQKPLFDRLKSMPVLKNPKIRAILAFGSRIKGNYARHSDLDLLIGVENKANPITEKIVEGMVSATQKTGVRFSPTILSGKEIRARWKEKDLFILNALNHGKIIKGAEWLEHLQTTP